MLIPFSIPILNAGSSLQHEKKQLKTPNLNTISSSEEMGIQDGGEENGIIVVKR